MKKEQLFDKLRGGITQQFDMPAKTVKGIVYEDIIKQFIEISKTVGGKVIEAKATDDLNAQGLSRCKGILIKCERDSGRLKPRHCGNCSRPQWN